MTESEADPVKMIVSAYYRAIFCGLFEGTNEFKLEILLQPRGVVREGPLVGVSVIFCVLQVLGGVSSGGHDTGWGREFIPVVWMTTSLRSCLVGY